MRGRVYRHLIPKLSEDGQKWADEHPWRFIGMLLLAGLISVGVILGLLLGTVAIIGFVVDVLG